MPGSMNGAPTTTWLIVRLTGLEPAVFGSATRRSIQLSYRRTYMLLQYKHLSRLVQAFSPGLLCSFVRAGVHFRPATRSCTSDINLVLLAKANCQNAFHRLDGAPPSRPRRPNQNLPATDLFKGAAPPLGTQPNGGACAVEVRTAELGLPKIIDKTARADHKRIVMLATDHSAMTRIRDILLDEENAELSSTASPFRCRVRLLANCLE